MKLLLDEMYAGLKEYLEALGYQVLTAQESGLQGAKDRDIVEYAVKHSLILVTQDQKPLNSRNSWVCDACLFPT
jgi:predicted nuclease of predicted toxin-antitoxin system